jgi:long-chain fatty acid transport protein
MMRLWPLNRTVWLRGIVAAPLLAGSSCAAIAGAFEIQQSAYFQGMSFAGVATGGPSLASMGWNPATSAFASYGLTLESSYAVVLPQVDLTVLNPGAQLPPPGTNQVDMGRDTLLGASFGAWRLNEKTVLGLSVISPFGLATKPDDVNWAGKFVAITSKVLSIDAVPSISYEILPGLSVGAGVQLQYFELQKLRAATPLGGSTIDGDDFGVGFMAGINYSPVAGTSVGLGFRSSVHHDLEGDTTIQVNPTTAALFGLAPTIKAPSEVEIDLPEKVTFSFRQALSPRTRLLGTIDWVNWSRFDVVPAVLEGPLKLEPLTPALQPGTSVANFVFKWQDGWLFALGGEYDWSPNLTLRAGVGYEISPIQSATSRLVQVPDNNHTWLSVGASYKVSMNSSIDFAYSHIFYEDDAPFEQFPASTLLQGAPPLLGTADVSIDYFSVSWKLVLGSQNSSVGPLK